MGVPTFYRWLSTKYTRVVKDAVEGTPLPELCNSNSTSGGENPNGEFDCLYLDMNGIIHPCCHPEDAEEPESEEDMFFHIFEYIDRLLSVVRPRVLLYMAIDGVAPRAKMNQQRSRRFKTAAEADLEESKYEEIKAQFEKDGRPVPPKKQRWDSNVITPGTDFMDRLAYALRYYVNDRLATDEQWKSLNVILTDANSPGEGEHKIMQYIRAQRSYEGYNPNLRHCLHGADADLIMLGLATHEPHFYILREAVVETPSNKCFVCGQVGHLAIDCTAGPVTDSSTPHSTPLPRDSAKSGRRSLRSSWKPLQFLQIPVLREYLANDFSFQDAVTDSSSSFVPDFERCVDDFVLMCFFVGNDFLPHLPSLSIHKGSIDQMMLLYQKIRPKMSDYLCNAGEINLEQLKAFVTHLGLVENLVFQEDKRHNERMKNRRNATLNAAAVAGGVASSPNNNWRSGRSNRGDQLTATSAPRPSDLNVRPPYGGDNNFGPNRFGNSDGYGSARFGGGLGKSQQPGGPYRRPPDGGRNFGGLRAPFLPLPPPDLSRGGYGCYNNPRPVPGSAKWRPDQPLQGSQMSGSWAVAASLPPARNRFPGGWDSGPPYSGPPYSGPPHSPPQGLVEDANYLAFQQLKGYTPPGALLPTPGVHGPPRKRFRDIHTNHGGNHPQAPLGDPGSEFDRSKFRRATQLVEPEPQWSWQQPFDDQPLGYSGDNGSPTRPIIRRVELQSHRDELSSESGSSTARSTTHGPMTPRVVEKSGKSFTHEENVDNFRASLRAAIKAANQVDDPEDDAKLGEGSADEWRKRYYQAKFKLQNSDDLNALAERVAVSYVEGLQWVLHYYYQGVCSWSWYYQFYYAPFASDLANFGMKPTPTLALGEPFKPLEQLMAVLPPSSGHCLPEQYANRMRDSNSAIADFYPKHFKEDPNGRRFRWQWVPLLPFIDESRLLRELSHLANNLTVNESRRNARTTGQMFVSKHNALAGLFALCQLAPSEDQPEATQTLSARLCPFIKGAVKKTPRGFVTGDEINCSTLSKELFPGVKAQSLSCDFYCTAKSKHVARLLPEAQPPANVLVQADLEKDPSTERRFNSATAKRMIIASLGRQGIISRDEVDNYFCTG